MSSLLPTLPLRLSFLDSLHQPITYTLPPVPFYQPRYITILTSSSHTHFLSTSTIYPCFFPTPHYQDLGHQIITNHCTMSCSRWWRRRNKWAIQLCAWVLHSRLFVSTLDTEVSVSYSRLSRYQSITTWKNFLRPLTSGVVVPNY